MKRILTILPLLSLFILMPMLSSAQQSPQAKPPASSAAPPQGAVDSAHTGHDQSSGHGAGGQANQSQDQDFVAKHDQFKADWKAMDERLNAKIEAMNAAKGDKRLEAMAAVINEMADQRSKMREMFMASHGKGRPGMGRGGRGGMMGGKGGMMGGEGGRMGGKGGMMGGQGGQDGGSSGGMCPNCPMMQGHGSGGHGAHGGTGSPGGQGQQSGSQPSQPGTD
jgi:hypothetical protein